MFTTNKYAKLTPSVAETIALCYQSMQCAVEYARAVNADPETPEGIKRTFLQIVAELNLPIGRIERKIPQQQRDGFKVQYKENDVLRLENIKRLYMRLQPEAQDALEEMVMLLEKGETIHVQHVNE